MQSHSPTTPSSAGAAGGPLQQPPILQVGALCWRRTKKGALRVLLVTSRESGRWVIPKGWPIRHRTNAEAAAREAWEEAGIRGTVAPHPVGVYGYRKRMVDGRLVPCVVHVFLLATEAREDAFPEAGQRRRKWFSPDKAAGKVREPDLAQLIRAAVTDALDAGGTAPPQARLTQAAGTRS